MLITNKKEIKAPPKGSIKAVLFMLLIAAFSVSSNAVFKSYACYCGGTMVTVMCDATPLVGNCNYVCASKCGSLTDCVRTDCFDCCDKTTCSGYVDFKEKEVCSMSCLGTCTANTQFCDIIFILQSIGAGIAVIMLMINGIKWILLADDPSGRQDARRGIYYVLIGIAIMVTALALVNFILVGRLIC